MMVISGTANGSEQGSRGVASRAVGGLVRGYQLVLSPWVTQQCRYHPSCSAYMLEAVRVHGAARGLGMGAWRLLRCNPFTPGGVDYVPGSPDAMSYAARATADIDQCDPADRRTADCPPSVLAGLGQPHDPAGSMHDMPAALTTSSAPRN